MGERREEIVRLAYEVSDATGRLEPEQADEVLAICLLRAGDQISEMSWVLALKSTTKARPRDGFAYWKTCIRNQLAEHGDDLETLMMGVGALK